MPDRINYLVMRCYRCGRLITKLEILRVWDKAEKSGGVHPSLCPCGSRHVSPTNPKLWEELFLPRVWKLGFYEVFLPWLRSRRRS
jgi:hypothetical protein